MVSLFAHKNMYDVLSCDPVQPVAKSVSFSDQVHDVESDSTVPTKDWDGSSVTSIMYANLIYDFMMSPRSVTLGERTAKISFAMSDKSSELMSEFLDEAENTVTRLVEPGVKNVPIWRKGGSHTKVSWCMKADNTSLVWVRLFSNALKRANPTEN